MGVNIFPSGGGGSPIKSIQRGVAASAGNITISAVDTSKTMVRSFSTGSSGSVAARGAVGSQSISANVAAHNLSWSSLATAGSPVFTPWNPATPAGNFGWQIGEAYSPHPIAGYSTTGTLGGTTGATGLTYGKQVLAQPSFPSNALIPAPAATWPIAAAAVPGNIGPANITGGTTDLTSAEFGIYLVDSTTITATGACRWEVIEFN